MSVTADKNTAATPVPKPEEVQITIDGTELSVPKGTLVIRAAEMLGINIPRFCDHPLLDPVGACRQCMVDVPDDGRGRPMPKPQASCTLEAMPGMKIATQETSPVAEKAQKGMLEFLLINHPLDCPICDKGGECPLQNQALSHGRGESRFHDIKRTYPKPINVSTNILLDRERCVLCARCTRFSEQIAGDPFIELVARGAEQQVGIYEKDPFQSYFSGNTIQICPVGALTNAAYRFRARPFDLTSTVTTCELCAAGCELRVDHRQYEVQRRNAGNKPEVNQEWNCDRGRFAFHSGRQGDRLTMPLVRVDGELQPASWSEAIDAAVTGISAAGDKVGLICGGRVTAEDAYGWSKFARAVIGTNNIDFRSRPHTDEEADFLAAHVAGRQLGQGATYADLEHASTVLLVSFEPEDETGVVFLRLRSGVRKNNVRVITLAPYASRGSAKLNAEVIPCAPGQETELLGRLDVDLDERSVVLVGERAAYSPGALAAAQRVAEEAGAKFAWMPRRAGDRGAVEAGCLPTLLPGGRPVSDPTARVDVQATWGVEGLPATPGLSAAQQLAAVGAGELGALIVGGVEPRDFRDPQATRENLENAPFVISIEQRHSEVTERADVVFPVGLTEERSGTFLNWEHRPGEVNTVIKRRNTMTDLRVLAALADALGKPLGIRTPKQARAEIDELEPWQGAKIDAPAPTAQPFQQPRGELVLSTWRTMIDDSRSNDGEPAMMGTARTPVARLGVTTAADLGLSDGDEVTVVNGRGELTLPLEVLDMVEGLVWVPRNAPGLSVGEHLAAVGGDVVRVARATTAGGQA